MEINLILTRLLTDDEEAYVRENPDGITQKFFYPIRRLLKNEEYKAGELLFKDDGQFAYHKLINKHESICGAALMSHVEIERILRISTKHLQRKDQDLAESGNDGIFDFIIESNSVQASAPSEKTTHCDIVDCGWSPEFAKFMLHIRDVGIHRVKFESSGPIIEGLPTYYE